MRLWSLHQKYLDHKGLLAVWREGLLAKKVLEGKTKGYKFHPQLDRFEKQEEVLLAINNYLQEIFFESLIRQYKFNKNKIDKKTISLIDQRIKKKIPVTTGQIDHERNHLLAKLKIRDEKKYKELLKIKKIELHPLFKIVKGNVEKWEKISDALE